MPLVIVHYVRTVGLDLETANKSLLHNDNIYPGPVIILANVVTLYASQTQHAPKCTKLKSMYVTM